MCYCHNTVDNAMRPAELRKRRAGEDDKSEMPSAAGSSSQHLQETPSSFSVVEVARIIFALILLAGGLSWFITGDSFIWNWRQLPTLLGQAQRAIKGPLRLTDEELAKYNGADPSLPIYVALNGSIYDVSASATTYGPGGSYSFFAGRDATRAFITGCFKEDLTPDLRGVEEMFMPIDPPDEVISNAQKKIRREKDKRRAKKQIDDAISHWAEVFSGKTGKPYFYAGEIVRAKDHFDKLRVKDLCEQARESRPKREDVDENT